MDAFNCEKILKLEDIDKGLVTIEDLIPEEDLVVTLELVSNHR